MTNPPNDERQWSAFRFIAGEMSCEEAEQFELLLASEQAVREAVARAVEIADIAAFVEDQRFEQRHERLVAVSGHAGFAATSAVFPNTVFPNAVFPKTVAIPARASQGLGANSAIWLRRVTWMACGAAACLLLGLAAQQWTPAAAMLLALSGQVEPDQPGLDANRAPNRDSHSGPNSQYPLNSQNSNRPNSPQLALAWVNARQDSSGAGSDSAGPESAGPESPGTDETRFSLDLADAGGGWSAQLSGSDELHPEAEELSEVLAPSWMVIAIEGLSTGMH